MSATARFGLSSKNRDSYLRLIQEFPLASIRSVDHFAAAQLVMDELLRRRKLDLGEETYLDALSDLVATFEDEYYPIPAATDADLLRHFIEAKRITQIQLSRETGIPKSTISEVLSGKKHFTRQIIHKLADYFDVPISVLAANF